MSRVYDTIQKVVNLPQETYLTDLACSLCQSFLRLRQLTFPWPLTLVLLLLRSNMFATAATFSCVGIQRCLRKEAKNEFALQTNTSINPYTRDIWYARYIDWVITTPLLLLELLLGTGLPTSDILFTVFMDVSTTLSTVLITRSLFADRFLSRQQEVMIITGLIGSLVVSSYKWG